MHRFLVWFFHTTRWTHAEFACLALALCLGGWSGFITMIIGIPLLAYVHVLVSIIEEDRKL